MEKLQHLWNKKSESNQGDWEKWPDIWEKNSESKVSQKPMEERGSKK